MKGLLHKPCCEQIAAVGEHSTKLPPKGLVEQSLKICWSFVRFHVNRFRNFLFWKICIMLSRVFQKDGSKTNYSRKIKLQNNFQTRFKRFSKNKIALSKTRTSLQLELGNKQRNPTPQIHEKVFCSMNFTCFHILLMDLYLLHS